MASLHNLIFMRMSHYGIVNCYYYSSVYIWMSIRSGSIDRSKRIKEKSDMMSRLRSETAGGSSVFASGLIAEFHKVDSRLWLRIIFYKRKGGCHMKKICLVLSALALCCTMLIGAGAVGTSSQMSLTQQAITHCLLPICFCKLDYTLSVVNLHQVFGNADINLLTNQIIGHGVFVFAIRNQVVVRNLCHRPDSGLKRYGGQRQHIRLFFLQISAAAGTGALLELAAVQLIQLFSNRLVDFLQREKLHITQCSNNPGLSKTNRSLCRTLVLWTTYSCRNNSCVVIVRKFLITAVQHRFISSVRRSCGLAVIRNEQPCRAAEIVERMIMTVQPVLCFHVVTGFCIDIAAAREHRYKQISAAPLSGNGIVDQDVSPAQSTWIASPGLC